MGYSHYWEWHGTPDKGRLSACLADMQRLVDAAQQPLAGPEDDEDQELGPLQFAFNGIGDHAAEPFEFPGFDGFNSCKTRHRPYDEIVTACLLVARNHFPPEMLEISSDGKWAADWQKGARLYSAVFDREACNPLCADGRAGA